MPHNAPISAPSIKFRLLSMIKIYISLFLLSAIINGTSVLICLSFTKNNMIETNTELAFSIFVLYHIVMAGVMTICVAFIRRYLWLNVVKLSEAAHKIASGDFSVRVTAYRNNNNRKNLLERLFDDFNTMTEKLASANEKLKALSVTDELTKLDNRRSFLEYANLLWKQSHRLQLPITVLMIDVDYFKKYNDSMGHLEGDNVLVSIAQCLKKQIKRETDFVARFGGEEFVCILPFIEKVEALDFAKTLVQSIEDMKIPHPMSEHSKYVTISVGMADTIPNEENTFNQLLDEADKALYSAKKSGRNRVVAG